VVNTTALRPVTLHASSNQVLVTRHEEEVVIDQLLAGLLFHTLQGVVGSREITLKLLESLLHQALNLQPLLLGNSRGESKSSNATSNTNPVEKDKLINTTPKVYKLGEWLY